MLKLVVRSICETQYLSEHGLRLSQSTFTQLTIILSNRSAGCCREAVYRSIDLGTGRRPWCLKALARHGSNSSHTLRSYMPWKAFGVRMSITHMYTHDFGFSRRRLGWVHICGSSYDF